MQTDAHHFDVRLRTYSESASNPSRLDPAVPVRWLARRFLKLRGDVSNFRLLVRPTAARALSRGGKSRPQRRTTSSSDQPAATAGSSRTTYVQVVLHHRKTCNRDREDFGKLVQPVVDPASSSISTSPSKNARRMQRVTQW